MSSAEDPHGYLETGARIIAENDVHAVVALRVEKSWIDRNLPVLAALVDAVSRSERKEKLLQK